MIFDWSNFEEHMAHVVGAHISPEWICESQIGKAISYCFDEEAIEGRTEFFEFSEDLKVLVFDCLWHEAKTFHVLDGDWIRFNFSLSIDISMQLSATKTIDTASPSWRVMNNLADVAVHESLPAGAKTVWLTICCKPDRITQLTGQPIENMPDLLKMAITADHYDSFHEYFDFTSRLNTITADVIRTDLSGGLRLAYVQARTIEILCLALNEVIHLQKADDKIRLTGTDKAAIEKARAVLLEHFEQPPTVSELSRDVGLNRNKLYYGFKALYGTTISDFIQSQRLEQGRELLIQTDMPILEVANKVGFKHQCNFSTAMKRHFGVTPSQLRN